MDDLRRQQAVESLIATVFMLRPDDGPAGEAWAMSVATGVLARSVLAAIGPTGDPEELLALALSETKQTIQRVQSSIIRQTLTTPMGRA